MSGKAQDDFSFDELFKKYRGSFDSILEHKTEHRLQIVYTQIDRDSSGKPSFRTFNFDVDKYYYYCASLVKLPAAIFCLEKANSLKEYGVSISDSFSTEYNSCGLQKDFHLTKFGMGERNLKTLIKKMFLVSDNNAFNPIYDFVTPQYFNERLEDMNFQNAIINRRFANCSESENAVTAPISFYSSKNKNVFTQEQTTSTFKRYNGELKPLIGNGHYFNGRYVAKPFDFSSYSYIRLSDLHKTTAAVFFPELLMLKLCKDDYDLLRSYMGMYPSESRFPSYDLIKYPDNYMKYFWRLSKEEYKIPSRFKLYNKVGQAYGFLTDCTYFQDEFTGIEFILSATIFVNKNQILNDGIYEYDSTGLPFLQNLFAAIYNYEFEHRVRDCVRFEKVEKLD